MKFFIVLAAAFLSVQCSHHGKPDMYWRDYNGTLPRDALRVIMNEANEPVYIGLGYFERVGLMPGMLHEGSTEMVVSYKGMTYTAHNNIKIMATSSLHPELDFQWIPIHYDDLGSTKSLQFLQVPNGGTAGSHPVYIGRLPDPEHRNIGQVNTVKPYQGLNIPNSKRPRSTVFRDFELLALLNFDCHEEANENSSDL